MYTLNLALIFDAGQNVAVVTCQSDEPMSSVKIRSIAMMYYRMERERGIRFPDMLQNIASGIQTDCRVLTTIVAADCVCEMTDKPKKGKCYL